MNDYKDLFLKHKANLCSEPLAHTIVMPFFITLVTRFPVLLLNTHYYHLAFQEESPCLPVHTVTIMNVLTLFCSLCD